MELILRVDRKGRILIPAEVRRLIGLKDAVRARIEDEKLILEPIRNPVEELTSLVVEKNGDIEKDISLFKEAAEKSLMGLAYGRCND